MCHDTANPIAIHQHGVYLPKQVSGTAKVVQKHHVFIGHTHHVLGVIICEVAAGPHTLSRRH